MTEELWSQIETLYEKSGNIKKKTRTTKRDDRLLGHGVALLERLSDLQRANIRQFRTFLTRPAQKTKDMKWGGLPDAPHRVGTAALATWRVSAENERHYCIGEAASSNFSVVKTNWKLWAVSGHSGEREIARIVVSAW
jgi:hypothetical protein